METEVVTAYNPFTFLIPASDDGASSLVEDGNEFSKIINGPLVDENLHWGEDGKNPQAADTEINSQVLIKIPLDTGEKYFPPVVENPISFLPFSIVEHVSSDTEQRLSDSDEPPPEEDETLSLDPAPVVPDAVEPIRPYADLKAINGPRSSGTGDVDPDPPATTSSRPPPEWDLNKIPNHPLPAGQLSLPHADKTSVPIPILAMVMPTQNPPATSVTYAADEPPTDTSETTLPLSVSRLTPKDDISTVAPSIDDGKFDQTALFHGLHRLREPDFIGMRIVHERVVHQIANALSHFAVKTDGNIVELILTPKELGACRFKMVVNGDRVDVDLAVDNPDVLQLMRRQVDLLITELKVAGFNQTSINSSEMKNGDAGFSRSQHDDQAAQVNFDPDTEQEISLMEDTRPLSGTGRLHLKL